MTRWVLARIACLVVVASVAAVAHAWSQPANTTPIAVVRALDDALNAHDPGAVLDLLADGATVQVERQPQTREQVQGWIDELVRQNVRVDLIGQPTLTTLQTPSGATDLRWRATLDLQMYRGLGVSPVPATLRATVVDGAIVFVSIRPNPDWNAWLDALTVA